MKLIFNFLFFIVFCFCMLACNQEKKEKSTEIMSVALESSEVVFSPLDVTPFPDAILEMYRPLNNDNFNPGKVAFEFNIKNHPFGTHRPLKLSLNGNEPIDYSMSSFRLDLKSGTYRAVAFLVDDKGLALKEFGNFIERDFTVGESGAFSSDEAPYLVLNLPLSGQEFGEEEPVVVDFLYLGGDLKSDGVTLKVQVGGNSHETSSLNPILLKGLAKGNHEITVALYNEDGEELSGIFSSHKRKFSVK